MDEPRRLRKAPPPGQTLPSDSYTSSKTLRRASSAQIRDSYSSRSQPHHSRSPTSPSPGTSSTTSIDSTLAANSAGATYNAFHQSNPGYNQRNYYQPRLSVTEKTSTDLLGQRFDSAAVLRDFGNIPYTSEQLPPQPRASNQTFDQILQPVSSRPYNPRHSNSAGNSPAVANPAVRLSQSLAATGRKMEDIPPSRDDLGARNPRTRYSDEAKDSKALKKKSGFSSFMNSLVGSPRRPAISAPENPVHVTHVGYDQETGEFTVRIMSCVS